MDNLWAYPYSFGIGIFLVVGTFSIMGFFIALSVWLEKDFKKDKQAK